MKRILCLVLVAVLSAGLLSGCAEEPEIIEWTPLLPAQFSEPEEDPPDETPEDLSLFPLPERERVTEYGTAAEYGSESEILRVQAEYPKGDVAVLDAAVRSWLGNTAASLQNTLEEESDRGAFAANYDSYEVNGRVVSVRITGVLRHDSDGRTEDVSACFCADRKTGTLLSWEDLLRPDGEEALPALAEERTGREWDSAGLPFDWLPTDEGLRLWLTDGETLDLPYGDLIGIFSLPAPDRAIDPNQPMVALTFDDGPSVHTEHILDLLAYYNAAATFFVVGSRVDPYAETVARATANGNEIGIHTWGHAKLTTLSREDITAQITDTQEAIRRVAGVSAVLLRPPGGDYDDAVCAVARDLGLAVVNWSVDPADWSSRDADAVFRAVTENVTDGAIILCHDLYGSTAEAMERIIPALIDMGYQLVTVSELLHFSEGGMIPGQVYRHR